MSVHVKGLLSAAFVLTLCGVSSAATLTASQTLYTGATSTNLTAEGTLDWTKSGPNEPGNYNLITTIGKTGGTALSDYVQTSNLGNPYIGNIATTHTFTWTDGDGPASDSSTIVKGPGGPDFSFTSAGDTSERVLRVYLGGQFFNNASISLSLPGAAPVAFSLTQSSYPDYDQYLNVVEVHYTADGPTDTLTVNTSGGAGIYAATLAPAAAVPEPASLGLVGLTTLLGLRRRRRNA